MRILAALFLIFGTFICTNSALAVDAKQVAKCVALASVLPEGFNDKYEDKANAALKAATNNGLRDLVMQNVEEELQALKKIQNNEDRKQYWAQQGMSACNDL